MSSKHPRPDSGPDPLSSLKRTLVQQIEAEGGRHDEAAIYSGDPGDPGLVGGPGSLSWELHGDLASIIVAGGGAILMEVLHPSVMAGVYTQSSYRTEPIRRARNTLGYVLRTTFGNTRAATRVIEAVRNVHARVSGTRPDGVPYRALDPELLAWVHTCIPWAIMTAYDRHARPLTTDEKNRYLREQAVIGRMGGADWVPETVPELADYVERMRPKLAMNEQTLEFVDFLLGRTDAFPVGRFGRLDRWASLRGSMALMPDWAQQLSGTECGERVARYFVRPSTLLRAKLVRWAYPVLPCKKLALARVRGLRTAPEREGVAAIHATVA
jgi:uncharacterized protein (DUF2236 family)